MTAAPTGADNSSRNKETAIEDATRTQSLITEECANSGTEKPPYELMALIGKGSFGRVYKARGLQSGRSVAIKIISIEEGDSFRPGGTDTLGDILKEINTLKLLSDRGAKNINCVLDTHLVGQSVWMVTEYCAGGSVATLMRPTGGLAEKWIIPILREVAEAIRWVHSQGVIHRDIKCANVLITETGGVQLCDFGVAGIIETKFDKRSTVTGTLQWMAPELFDSSTLYGVEVDIWAFGSMAYEVATGLPPNATGLIDIANFGSYLKRNCPRLEGDQYSSHLRDIVACCMVLDPAQRPTIGQVQAHPYIFNTAGRFPTSSLSKLVDAYRIWEMQGGSRKSLFSAGGAQGHVNVSSLFAAPNDEWNFGTLDDDSSLGEDDLDAQTIRNAYGPAVDLDSQLPKQPSRRRPPIVKPLVVPLEQVFDPNSSKNYDDNARAFYGHDVYTQTTSNDLPLRDGLDSSTIRESLIDLDVSLDGNHLSQFVDMGTIRAGPQSALDEMHHTDTRRLTQDWKFPHMAPVNASLEYAPDLEETSFSNFSAGNLFSGQNSSITPLNRTSTMSLIDLDASIPDKVGLSFARPSTAGSDNVSIGSDMATTPFELEEHVLDATSSSPTAGEPCIYVTDDVGFGDPYVPRDESLDHQFLDMATVKKQTTLDEGLGQPQHTGPVVPAPPSVNVMLGTSTQEELKQELRRLVSSLGEHLHFMSDTLAHLPAKQDL
ncbi:hypothetical protein ED733_000358 [Metarhizium rileyi]|uniref:non-specific serine/threonine protein kinase n=1 Tax=Metarhizium rileyi (strain RCEF 4871) TaxID=1649241 RepID=A0A5C6FYF4_METRR|nr:hypothetical protein ED733_000358 [Metarhizium rileyi]